MSNYREDRSQSSLFQNGTDQQGRRTPHEDPPHIPQDQLVGHFRSFIAQQQEENRRHAFSTSPAHIIRSKLNWESGPAHTDPKTRSQAFDFWQPLILAWDALAYDRYDPNSFEKSLATNRLSSAYEASKLSPRREPAIQLTRYQAGIIDALTDAAGIPHEKGQTEIAIPEHVKANSERLQERMREVWLQMCGGGDKPPKR